MKIQPKLNVKTKDNSVKVLADIKNLTGLQVLVGVPETIAQRPKNAPINNAQLAFVHSNGVRAVDMRRIVRAKMNRGLTFEAATAAYIHTHGSALYQIPPRPIIQPAIEAPGNKEPITEQLKLAAQAILAGNKTEALRHLRFAGLTAQNAARAWFTDPRNHWAPNAPSTIKRKGSSRPLIATGELRKSITYVVVDNG